MTKTEVEFGSARARCTLKLTCDEDEDEDEKQDDSVVESYIMPHRAVDPDVLRAGGMNGIRYQRCGGGRRVIRRKKGGD